MDDPAVSLEHLLAEAVAISRRARAVIRRAVTLDADEIAPRMVGVAYRNVDEEASDPHLCLDVEAEL